MSAKPMHPGDVVKVERRYIVDGVLTCVTDQGRFEGVQVLGSSEHLVLKDASKKEVRMIPLSTVSEITLIKRARLVHAQPKSLDWDPSFA